MAPTLPFGTWPSPIEGADIADAGHRYEDLAATDDALWFTRTDPESGEMRLHRWRRTDGAIPMAPRLDVRGRVHEYGGGAIMVGPDAVVVVDHAQARLHRVHADGSTTPITPSTDLAVRYGAGEFLPDGRLVVVRETHHRPSGDDGNAAGPAGGGDDATSVVNELVVVDIEDGTATVLVDDHDFVGDPRVGADGWIAWITWDHPHMPWDESVLWAGRVLDDELRDVRRVAGGDGTSIADWAWSGDRLVHTDDRSGFWEVYREDPARPGGQALTSTGIDLGLPRWWLGQRTLAVVGDTVAVVGVRDAAARLGVVGEAGWQAVTAPGHDVGHVVAHRDWVATIESDVDGTQAVRLRDLRGDLVAVVDEIPSVLTRPGDVPEIMPIATGEGSDRTHGFLHLPANADVDAPATEAPPLVMFVHGGPTSHVAPVTSAGIAFWTTRGFAVLDLNYRGSSGFGREYRRLMRGRWGEIEVTDAIRMATELARRGLVDGDCMAIRGGSAGGFTALAAVTRPGQPFACATSIFGVADLAALAEHTHKFESRYLDSMVGRLPEDRDVYDRRSPITNIDNLDVPILVLQGLDDKVVPPAQAEAIVAGARRRGVPHAHITFAGEGHGFRKPANIIAWHLAELAFCGEVFGIRPAGSLPTVLG